MKTKIYKVLSIMLTLAVILSTCLCAIGTVSAKSDTYYVSATGSDNNVGTSVDAPVTSVTKAVELAVADGYGSDDTVTIKVMGTEVSMDRPYLDGATTMYASMPVITFDLIIESNDPDTRTKIVSNNAILGAGEDVNIAYNNVHIYKSGEWSSFQLCGSNILFDEKSKVEHSWGNIAYGTGNDGGARKTIGGQKVVIKSEAPSYITLTNSSWSGRKYTDDVTLVLDNATANPSIQFNVYYSGAASGDVTFTKNLNIDIKSASAYRFLNPNGVIFKGEDWTGALQFIDSTGIDFDAQYKTAANQNPATINETLAQLDADKYIIHNKSGNKDLLDFTETAGKFEVSVDTNKYIVKATSTNGDVITAQGGFLTLTPGEYNVDVEKLPETITYYVSATGDDAAAGSEQAPLLTINGAVEKANAAGYMKGDTVYVKVLGTTGVLWKSYLTPTYLTQYTYLLDISSATSGATVGASNDVVTTSMVELNGPTKISNIKIANKSSNGYIGFGFYGNDVEIGEGTTFSTYYVNYQLGVWNNSQSAGGASYSADQNIVFKSKDTRYLNLGNNYGSATYQGDINVTVDHASANPVFYFSSSNAKATYNGNINLNFKQAAGITLTKNSGGSHTFGPNAAIQVINSTPNAITASTGELTNISAPKYIINNGTGNKEIIQFTDTVGKFKVDTAATAFEIVAKDADGNFIRTDDAGYITLPAAGVYELILYKDPEIVTYYVSASGSDDAKGTKSAPVKTVVGAIKRAISENMIKGDVVNVVVLDDTAWFQADETSTPAHGFKLIVSSKDAQSIVAIKTNPGMFFGGETALENLNFSNFGQYNSVKFNDYDITIGTNTSFNPYAICLGSSSTGNTVEGQKVVFNNAVGMSSGIRISNDNNGTKTYSEDVNVVINNAAATTDFILTMTYGDKVTYKKNLNFYVDDANKVSMYKSHWETASPTVEAQGAIQYIIDNGKDVIGASTKEYIEDVAPAKGAYYIYNKSGVEDLLSFTETVGKYFVDTEVYDVVAIDADGNSIPASDGYLTLSAEGTYTVTATARPATTLEYFVEEGSSAENTFDTVAEAVAAAKTAGLTKIDFLNIKVTGSNVTIGELPEYKFTVIVESKDEKATLNTNDPVANGKTIYRNIDLSGMNLDLNGKEVTLESTVGFNGLTIDASGAKAIINAKLPLIDIICEESIDLVVNNAESEFTVDFGSATFNEIKINVKSANKVSFMGTPDVKDIVEIAVPSNVAVVGKNVIDAIGAENKWYIVNTTGKANAIDFTDVAGTYTYISGYQIAMVGNGNTYQPVNVKLIVPAGEYEVVFIEQPESKYSDYIKNRGTGLKNTYAKLKSGEDVNVLYFGGSVTNGTGASDAANTSWRGLTGKWIENAFSGANVNNINVAYGGTSTMFGSYRLKEEVLSQAPDLIFIEFSINDHYDNTSTRKPYPVTRELAAKRFETIVRQIRFAYPECDIVTLLTTEKMYIGTNRKGNLHEQAKGHEDISIAYDIPSIHIGRALSDHLSPNYADNEYAEWNSYMMNNNDIVHPNDKGYAIYFDVIKEYLASELIYGEGDAIVTEHTVPELQSDSLIDGEITYIDASEDLIDKSEELGGSGFSYKSSGGLRGTFVGGMKLDSANGKFVIKFTGTELALLANVNNATEYTVTVDGGTATTVKTTGIYPDVITTGLKYGEHTVEIVPVFTGEVKLEINGFFTRDETKATHKHVYDHACDTDCNIEGCDFTRETEHKFDHDCDTECNTEGCGFTRTTEHVYENDCDTECNVEGCGFTRTTDHKFDNVCDTDCNVEGCDFTREVSHVFDHDCDTDCNTEGCDFTRETEHKFDHDCDTDCNTEGCDFTRETEHKFDHDCDTDCNTEGCGFTRTTEHVYDHDCDTDCNTEGCGFTRTTEHVYDHACDTECNVEGCGFTRTTEHVYDNDCDADCNECGATRTPADHVYDNDCDADCNECGATRTPADHVYDNDCDADCNECGATRTPADHVYDDGCDVDCNVCGETRTTEHVYDNDCDADCNECGETRTPADHVYDNDCDADCNECGATRTPADHVYDNDCDADCNECGATRTPADHVYDNNSDADCNECGATRQLGAQLIEEDGVKYYYYDGVKSTATGLVEFEGKQMYINKGRFLGSSGLVTIGGKKMYINKGYFTGATGIVTLNGKKMYISKGYFLGKSGLVTVGGKKAYINKGYFTGASGIVTLNGKKMYISKGYFLGKSGLVTVGGKKAYINKGYFTGATGIVTINGKKHYINKGYFTGASGKVKVGGKTYTVVKGIVK